jgi:hypothetical protein
LLYVARYCFPGTNVYMIPIVYLSLMVPHEPAFPSRVHRMVQTAASGGGIGRFESHRRCAATRRETSSDVISTIPKLARSSPSRSRGVRSPGIGEIRRLRICNYDAFSWQRDHKIALSHWSAFLSNSACTLRSRVPAVVSHWTGGDQTAGLPSFLLCCSRLPIHTEPVFDSEQSSANPRVPICLVARFLKTCVRREDR